MRSNNLLLLSYFLPIRLLHINFQNYIKFFILHLFIISNADFNYIKKEKYENIFKGHYECFEKRITRKK
jgi:hypothetical protein